MTCSPIIPRSTSRAAGGASSQDALELASKKHGFPRITSGEFGTCLLHAGRCQRILGDSGRLRTTPDCYRGRVVDAAHAESVDRFIGALIRLRFQVGNPSLRRLAELWRT